MDLMLLSLSIQVFEFEFSLFLMFVRSFVNKFSKPVLLSVCERYGVCVARCDSVKTFCTFRFTREIIYKYNKTGS